MKSTSKNTTLLENVNYLQKLWAAVLPNTPPPPVDSFSRWAGSYSVPAIEEVINQIPYRLARGTPSPDAIYHIVSSQLKSRKIRVAQSAVKETGFAALLKIVSETEMTEQNCARCYSMFILQEMANSPTRDLSAFSPEMLTMTIFIQQQSLSDTPNLKLVASKTRMVCDSLEARTGSGEGAALARLSKLESAMRDAMRKDDARGNHV